MKIVSHKETTFVFNFIGSPKPLKVEYSVEKDTKNIEIMTVWFMGLDITEALEPIDLDYLELQCHIREV